MFDNLAIYFHHSLVDSLNAYLETAKDSKAGLNRDLRLALNAATTLYHFREHFAPHRDLSHNDVAHLCPDYDLLRDVVNAVKHGKLAKGTPQIDSASKIEEVIVVTEYHDERGRYVHADKRVVVVLDDGTRRELLEVLISVMNFWQSELAATGVIAALPARRLPTRLEPRPRSEANGGGIDQVVLQGVAFRQVMQLNRYNYSTGQVEPIDLTGSQAVLNIYKPIPSIDLCVINHRTGRQFTRSIQLNDEEQAEYVHLQSEPERQQYLASLPQTHAAMRSIEVEMQQDMERSSGRRRDLTESESDRSGPPLRP